MFSAAYVVRLTEIIIATEDIYILSSICSKTYQTHHSNKRIKLI